MQMGLLYAVPFVFHAKQGRRNSNSLEMQIRESAPKLPRISQKGRVRVTLKDESYILITAQNATAPTLSLSITSRLQCGRRGALPCHD